MKRLIQSGLIIMLLATNSFAEEPKTSDRSKLFTFAVLEAAAVANSYAASKSPGGYAAGMIILYPLIEEPANTKKFWGGLAVLSIVPVYNFYLDKQLEDGSITRSDVFKRNMIAWNLLGTIAYVLLQDEGEDMAAKDKNGMKMGLSPAKNGMQLSMHYQF